MSLDRTRAGTGSAPPAAGTRWPPGPWHSARPDLWFGKRRTILLGFVGTILVTLGGIGAGAVLEHDPLLSGTSMTWVRFGHGRQLAAGLLYLGLAMVIWAWVRMGRAVRAEKIGSRTVLWAVVAWTLPLLFAPSLFSKDIYSYLAQGDLALHGFNPYLVGPSVLPNDLTENVSWVWQNTPAPYGPLFILLAKGVVAATGEHVLPGVILLRAAITVGLAGICWAIPRLTRHLGGNATFALWLGAANPLLLIHLVGGAHNDLLMLGMLAVGVVLVLDRRPVLGIALVTMAVAVKATAALALPFLVWVWAGRLPGGKRARFLRAAGGGVGIFAVVFTVCSVVARLDLGWLPALASSSAIVNWLSLPTGFGELVHWLLGRFVELPAEPFLNVARVLGWVVLAGVVARQWWLARGGGPDAVRRAGIALLAVALLSPATFPWYLTWPLVICAGLAWSRSAQQVLCWGSVMLLLVTFPSGDTVLYSWWFLAGFAVVATVAAKSLDTFDPLRISSKVPVPVSAPGPPRPDPTFRTEVGAAR